MVDLFSEDSIDSVISFILKKFNEKFKNEMINHQFDISKENNFELYYCSKTGKIKSSIPGYLLYFIFFGRVLILFQIHKTISN